MMSKSTDRSMHVNPITHDQQEMDAAILLSDRQRRLCQRSALLLAQLASATATDAQVMRVELHQVLDTLATTHIALITGDAALGLPIAHSAAVHQIYFEPPVHLDRHLKHYLQQSAAFLAQPDTQLLLADPTWQQLITTDAVVLLEALETLVSQYRQADESASSGDVLNRLDDQAPQLDQIAARS
jgi:two-component system, NtrC family, sensor kinase